MNSLLSGVVLASVRWTAARLPGCCWVEASRLPAASKVATFTPSTLMLTWSRPAARVVSAEATRVRVEPARMSRPSSGVSRLEVGAGLLASGAKAVTVTVLVLVRPWVSVATAVSTNVPAKGAAAVAVNGPVALVVATSRPLTENCTLASTASGSVTLAASETGTPTATAMLSGGLVMAIVGWTAPPEGATINVSAAVPVPVALAAESATLNVPLCVGVPEIRPVAVSSGQARRAGRWRRSRSDCSRR